MAIDFNHPAYAAAQQLKRSGWQSQPIRLDIQQLLANDPMLQGQFRQIGWGDAGATGGGALAGALAPLDERYRQTLVSYGGIPTGVQVDDTLRALAGESTASGLSTLAQLQRAYQLANSASTGSVGARGLGRSGAVGQHMIENLYNYDIQRGQAETNLLDTLASIRQQKAAVSQTAMGQAQTAMTDAFNRLVAQVQTGMIASPVPNTVAANYAPGLRSVSPFPRTNPATFTPSPQPTLTGGQPRNQFQYLPGRGRAPLGGPSRPAAPVRQPSSGQHVGGFLVPDRGRVPY